MEKTVRVNQDKKKLGTILKYRYMKKNKIKKNTPSWLDNFFVKEK